MNCKQGQWAVIVKSHANNLGVVVRCERLYENLGGFSQPGPRWFIGKPVKDTYGDPITSVADSALLPLRRADLRPLVLLDAGAADLVALDA